MRTDLERNEIKDLGIDPIGVALGFGNRGYHRFTTKSGVGGLAKWTQDRLDILAIHSDIEGKGYVRDFFRFCQGQFKTIGIWCIWNSNLASALKRYGFEEEVEVQGDGEILEGMRWDKNQ